MGGAAVAQVADQGDIDPVDGHGLAYRVEVEQGLGRVLAGTVTGIDDRYRGKLGSEPCSAFFRVADHDSIRIPAHDPDGIGKGLPFCHGTGLDAAHRERCAPEARHGGFKGHACAGTGFKKEDGKDLAAKSIFIILFLIDLCRMIQQVVDLLPVKVSDGNDMSRCHPSSACTITFAFLP